MTKTKPEWRIDDRVIHLSITDQILAYLEGVKDSEARYCCDVNLRTAIQLVLAEPYDPEQMHRLGRCLSNPSKMLRRIEREHRPKVAAAIDEFREIYKNWSNTQQDEN